MRIAVDFDGTIVDESTAYDDLTTPLQFLPGAKQALLSMRDAGHVLILWSCRSNLALRDDWQHNPHWANDPKFDLARWEQMHPVHVARWQQMLDFVQRELPGVFTFIDYGNQGKVSADLYLDDRALKLGGGYLGTTWDVIERWYGSGSETPSESDDSSSQLRVSDGQDAGAVPRRSRLPAGREVRVRPTAHLARNRHDPTGRAAQARPRVRPRS